MMMKTRQRGSTALGLILGALVGLAVALSVAIYVTKVPVPFVNKGAARTSGQDAAEAAKNRDWDPNAPLRNRNDAKAPATGGATAGGSVAPAPEPAVIPAPTEATAPATRPVPLPAEVKPADTATAAAAKPASRPERAAEKPPNTRPAPSSDPLGELAAARAGAGAVSADPFTYFVQAGAFRAQDDADAQRARLSLMGVEARVSEREQAGRTVYRVRVGPFQNRDAADRIKARLDDNGFDAALVRVQK